MTRIRTLIEADESLGLKPEAAATPPGCHFLIDAAKMKADHAGIRTGRGRHRLEGLYRCRRRAGLYPAGRFRIGRFWL